MMRVTHFDTEAEWKLARRKLVTGSKAPVILGLSPYQSPLELWSRDVGILADDPQTPRQKLGHHLESAILGMLAEEADVYVEPCRWALAVHPDFPELGYSMDGFVHEALGELAYDTSLEPLGIAEAKNRAGFHAAEDWDGKIPDDVNAQIQHGMDVCRLPAAWVGVLLAGGEFRWAKVDRDDAFIEANRPALLEYARRVREEDAPEPTGREGDRKAIVARWPKEEADKILPLPAEAIDLALVYRDAKAAEKIHKGGGPPPANRLAVMMGDAETGLLPSDFGKVTFKTTDVKARIQEAYSFRGPRIYLKKGK